MTDSVNHRCEVSNTHLLGAKMTERPDVIF